MSNTLTGAGAAFLASLDFSSAIAATTDAIEKAKATGQGTDGNGSQTDKKATKPEETSQAYLCRGYAHCFVDKKDKKNLVEAIEDCSMAIALSSKTPLEGTAHRVRAYAAYLKSDTAQALADCKSVIDAATDNEDVAFAQGLLAKVYYDSRNYEKALEACLEALKPNQLFPNHALADLYRQICAKMAED